MSAFKNPFLTLVFMVENFNDLVFVGLLMCFYLFAVSQPKKKTKPKRDYPDIKFQFIPGNALL